MILDQYILEKSLGKGAYGEVYLTKIKGDSKLIATKKLDKDFCENETTKKYIINEINILKLLNHPNIVKFIDLKRTQNHYYIMMEYCNGGELSKVLGKYTEKNGKPFPPEIVQHLMKQIIDAFKYIHGKDIMHRDIKLENILLNYDNNEDKESQNLMKANVKIIDFGFAAKIDKNELKYTTLGSPINMDPLILSELRKRGKKTQKLGYDKKADIWSIGTICYEMAIGKNAFDAEKLDELIEKVEKGEYTVPTNLPKELISFINGMLQYDSDKRLNIEQLSNHSFLKKNVNEFHKIDLQRVNKNIVRSKLKLNVKGNKTIWAVFNEEDEDKLMKIKGDDFAEDKPIAEFDHKKANSNQNLNNKIKDNNNNNNLQNNNNKNPLMPNNNINNNINNNNLNNNKINNNNLLNNNINNNNINNNNNFNNNNLKNNNINNNNLNNNNINNNNLNKNNIINNNNINNNINNNKINNMNNNMNNNINKNQNININNNINANKNINNQNNYANQKPIIPLDNRYFNNYNNKIQPNLNPYYAYQQQQNQLRTQNIPKYVNRGSFPTNGNYYLLPNTGMVTGYQAVQPNQIPGIMGMPAVNYQPINYMQRTGTNVGYPYLRNMKSI